MSKHEAVRILIQHTTIFTEEIKDVLLTRIDSMTDEDIQNLGLFLTAEKEKTIAQFQQKITRVDDLLAKLESSNI